MKSAPRYTFSIFETVSEITRAVLIFETNAKQYFILRNFLLTKKHEK